MKVSLIINVYKDTTALGLIFKNLQLQTYKDFEVVVAEDGQSSQMKELIEDARNRYFFSITHTTQEDIGIRKAQSQNNGIKASKGDYLIFIDGDCIPYTTFVESHYLLAEEKTVLSGRRVNLTQEITEKIKNHQLEAIEVEKKYWKFYKMMFDRDVRYEQGIYIHPNSFINKYFLSKRKRHTSIIGCHFSCWKKDIEAINGFDEGYGESGVSDDVDLDWRFRASGLEIKSCKNVANMFHLWHKSYDRGDASEQMKLMEQNKKENKYICENGLNLH